MPDPTVTPREVGDTPRAPVAEFEAQWIEVPDYRGLIERLAAMTERSGLPSEIIAAYDALANEAQAILKETEAAPASGEPTQTRHTEAAERGMEWIECEECHGSGSVFSPDGSGQHWCMGCHGEGGKAVHPSRPPASGKPSTEAGRDLLRQLGNEGVIVAGVKDSRLVYVKDLIRRIEAEAEARVTLPAPCRHCGSAKHIQEYARLSASGESPEPEEGNDG